MKKLLIVLVILIIIVAVIMIVGKGKPASAPTVQDTSTTQSPSDESDMMPSMPMQETSPMPSSTSAPQAGAASVSIQNFAFSPTPLTVKAGTKVTWQNSDQAGHSIVSDTGAFQSATLATGDTYSFTFDTAGTYIYHCGIHPMMKGTIIVQ
ncbi:MAG TPA: cupredoxin family copper-binding protein [Candidatus Paceibacterota bacterium]|nr:cupredoxin family copper-binding protein [Candidatus Paceibacterota bacterium]